MASESTAELSKWPFVLKAVFIKSSSTISDSPQTECAEIIFLGRSNVGKSSLLNMLTGHKELARTSSKPGKTRLFNHFLIEDKWLFTDVPGYGFARVSFKERELWNSRLNEYLLNKKQIKYCCLLVDINVPWQSSDLHVMSALQTLEKSWILILTKVDRLPKSKAKSIIQKKNQDIFEKFSPAPLIIPTSAKTKLNRSLILNTLFSS